MRSVCFTGHRIISNTQKLSEMLKRKLGLLIEKGAVDFYAGGAKGWDMMCEKAILDLKRDYPHIKLHLILPCCEKDQTAKWSEKQTEEYRKIEKEADSVERICEEYENGCMEKRNRRLVESADLCLCYYDKSKFRSGTGQTVRMAEKKGIEIINLI